MHIGVGIEVRVCAGTAMEEVELKIETEVGMEIVTEVSLWLY